MFVVERLNYILGKLYLLRFTEDMSRIHIDSKTKWMFKESPQGVYNTPLKHQNKTVYVHCCHKNKIFRSELQSGPHREDDELLNGRDKLNNGEDNVADYEILEENSTEIDENVSEIEENVFSDTFSDDEILVEENDTTEMNENISEEDDDDSCDEILEKDNESQKQNKWYQSYEEADSESLKFVKHLQDVKERKTQAWFGYDTSQTKFKVCVLFIIPHDS